MVIRRKSLLSKSGYDEIFTGTIPDEVQPLWKAKSVDELPAKWIFIPESAASHVFLSWLFSLVIIPVLIIGIITTTSDYLQLPPGEGQPAGVLVGSLLAQLGIVFLLTWCIRSTRKQLKVRHGVWMYGILMTTHYLVFRSKRNVSIYPRNNIKSVRAQEVRYRKRADRGCVPLLVLKEGKQPKHEVAKFGAWRASTEDIVKMISEWLTPARQ